MGQLPPVPAEAARADLPLMEQTVSAAWHGPQLWAAGLWAECQPAHSRIVVQDADASQAAWSLVFTEIHRAGGWLPLHAAVVSYEGQAVAITGVSGAGKSTATLRLLELGYQVVCEDRAFWHPVTGQVTGLDRCLRAFGDSVERFAPHHLEAALAGPRDAKGKLLLPLDAAAPMHLSRVLLLGRAPTPLNAAERVRLLWETTGVPLTRTAREQVQRGVGALLPLLDACPATRETVLARVRETLES